MGNIECLTARIAKVFGMTDMGMGIGPERWMIIKQRGVLRN